MLIFIGTRRGRNGGGVEEEHIQELFEVRYKTSLLPTGIFPMMAVLASMVWMPLGPIFMNIPTLHSLHCFVCIVHLSGSLLRY